MKLQNVVLVLLVASSAQSDEGELFFVDSERIKEVGVDAVHEKYPEIPRDSLELQGYVSVYCIPDLFPKAGSGAEEESESCTANMSFSVTSTFVETKYIDENGICFKADEYEQIQVEVFSDGNTNVGKRGLRGGGSRSVKCTEESNSLSK